MGWFFGSSSDTYSQIEHQLSRQTIERLVSRTAIRTLDTSEEHVVEDTIDAARAGDGKISLYSIDKALRRLVQTHKISVYDKKGLMKAFEKQFEQFS